MATGRQSGTIVRPFFPFGIRVFCGYKTTGGSVREVVDVVNEAGGEIVGVGLLVNRSGGKADFGVPKEKVQALLNLTVPTFEADACPLCQNGTPMTERGSKHIK